MRIAETSRRLFLPLLLILCAAPARAQSLWPDLSTPPEGAGGGEKDAAVIVGIEDYAFVEKIPGARQNAEDWQAYLTGTLKVPAEKIALLRDGEATLEDLRKHVRRKAEQVEEGGTLWFVFIGHGAPSKDGQDGLLIGADAQQRAESLDSRSLRRSELLELIAKGKQARAVVLLDACFSGRSPGPRSAIWRWAPCAAGPRTRKAG
jgi:hypothetical protein